MNENIELIRSGRKSISVEISRDCEIIVRAPYAMTMSEINRFLASRESWIKTHYAKMYESLKQRDIPEPFTDGELKSMKESLSRKLSLRVNYYSHIMNAEYRKINIRPMKSRWGSCSSERNLCFNSLLDFVPDSVLDYVIVHELCHITEMNHSRAFWTLVKKYMPDYIENRNWLKANGSKLISRLDK